MKINMTIFIFFIFLGCNNNPKLIDKTVIINDSVRVETPYNADGIIEGVLKTYDLEGNLVKTIEMKEGTKNGYRMNFYKTGELASKVLYKNGVKEGDYFTYYIDGSLKEKGRYSNDLGSGYFYHYYSSGIINQSYFENKGLAIGTGKEFYEDGRINKHVIYNFTGEIVYYAEYNNEGLLTKSSGKGLLLSVKNKSEALKEVNLKFTLPNLDGYDNELIVIIKNDDQIISKELVTVHSDTILHKIIFETPGEYLVIGELFHEGNSNQFTKVDSSSVKVPVYISERKKI